MDEPPPVVTQVEGLALQLSPGSRSGYTHVRFQSRNTNRPYAAQTRENGSIKHLGSFATAVEAAACISRHFLQSGEASSTIDESANMPDDQEEQRPPTPDAIGDAEAHVSEELLEAEIEQAHALGMRMRACTHRMSSLLRLK